MDMWWWINMTEVCLKTVLWCQNIMLIDWPGKTHASVWCFTLQDTCEPQPFLSLFHPKDDRPKTLDVLEGVRSVGTPLTDDGAELTLWIQEHPIHEHRSVNVLILKRYVSQEFKRDWEAAMDEVSFQRRHGGGDYVRFASKGSSFVDSPMVIFGNSKNTTNYKATVDMS